MSEVERLFTGYALRHEGERPSPGAGGERLAFRRRREENQERDGWTVLKAGSVSTVIASRKVRA